MINNIPRDYAWDTYGTAHYDLCRTLDLNPSKLAHVVHAKDYSSVLGIGQMLSKFNP
jgi:hypothetical protein